MKRLRVVSGRSSGPPPPTESEKHQLELMEIPSDDDGNEARASSCLSLSLVILLCTLRNNTNNWSLE